MRSPLAAPALHFAPAQHLLHESRLIREPAQAGAVHEVLLIRYAAATHRALLALHQQSSRSIAPRLAGSTSARSRSTASEERDDAVELAEAHLARVRRLATAYKPSARVWAEVFAQEAGAHTPKDADIRAMTAGGGAEGA